MKEVKREDLVVGNTYYDVDDEAFRDKLIFNGVTDDDIKFKPANDSVCYIVEDGLISFSKIGSVFYED